MKNAVSGQQLLWKSVIGVSSPENCKMPRFVSCSRDNFLKLK